MDTLTQKLHGLSRPNIRQEKPGYAPAYYDLMERLEEYAAALLRGIGIVPDQISGGPGETGAFLKATHGAAAVFIKIGIWDGELFTSNVFYEKLQATDIPTPQVLHFDASKRLIPYEFQVLEFLPGSDVSQLPARYHPRAGRLIGQALREVHRIEVDGFGSPSPTGDWSHRSWLAVLRETYLDDLSRDNKKKLYTEAEIARIEGQTFFDERLEIETPRLIHADVGPGNGLYRMEGDDLVLTGFIDPGCIIGGDPLFDLPSDRDDFATGLLEAYTREGPLSEEEQYRYDRLRLLSLYWTACWQCATGREDQTLKQLTIRLSEDLCHSHP